MILFDIVINFNVFLIFFFRSKKKFLRIIKGFEKKKILKEIKVFGENGLYRNMYNKYMDVYVGFVYF